MRHTSGQRVLDLILGCSALVLLSPAMLFTAALVRREDGGPVFFEQPRAGRDGKPFKVIKFRSMRPGYSGLQIDRSEWQSGVPDGFIFKASTAGSGQTKIGGTLRRLSLDELPQLLNVLRGEMSLVGPRPEILPIAESYNTLQRRRLEVRPGITGWAQVNGRAESDHGTKIAADLYWVDHGSLGLYFYIIARTAVATLTGRGAF